MKRWSQEVTEHSNALDLDNGVFALESASANARSLKRSADRSKRRKASPFQSAMSMLNFYLNRAGKTVSGRRRRVLEDAKTTLRKLYGKATGVSHSDRTMTAKKKLPSARKKLPSAGVKARANRGRRIPKKGNK
ncbi:MAG: DUF3175 domain-containing protein [Bryobacteraceae bacterium]|jgi:Protein of unknown function (DUF3175)